MDSLHPITPLYHQRCKKCQIILSAVIFFSGMVIGAAGILIYFEYRMFRTPPKPENMAVRATQDMKDIVTDLTDEQVRLVEQAFSREFKAIDSIREASQNQMDQRQQVLADTMKSILNPNQFEIWIQDFKARTDKMRPPPPPPPGPRPGGRPRP